MRRTLAITAATALLALSLAGCGDTADRTNGGVNGGAGTTTATDTMHNDDGMTGTGTSSGATANGSTTGTGTNGTGMTGTDGANTGLGGVAGAVNRGGASNRNGTAGNGYTGSGYANGTMYSGRDGGVYTATNNGSVTSGTVDYSNDAAVHRAAKAGDNYARMLENGRVHDSDGFLLDGENAHWRTF